MHQDSQDGVPVDKMTSFNGGLNQYLHTSGNVAPIKESISKVTASSATDILAAAIKRKPESQSSSSDPSSPKRRKATAPTLSRRITRSRSASSTLASIASPTPGPGPKPELDLQPPLTPPSTRQQISLLRDTIPPNLTLLLVGVNPGIMTGSTGFAYAHPSNLFWKLLHWSGITPMRHPPSDTYRLPELYNIGNTNIIARPTRDASMLSKAEMHAGVPVLEAKVAAQRPEAVCLVGKSIWEAVWRVRKGRAMRKEEFRYGWQDEGENMGRGDGWEGARVFVATTTSGLAAGMSLAEKKAVWDELGSWVVKRREAGQSTDLVTAP